MIYSILFDINDVTVYACVFSSISIVQSVFEYISMKDLLDVEMATVIKLMLKSDELSQLKDKEFQILCNHRKDITIEISKIIDIDRRSIELLLPTQTKIGLNLTFYIRTIDSDQHKEIMKLIRTEAKSGYLAKSIRQAWKLQKQPTIKSIETKELRSDINLHGDSNKLAAIINIKNSIFSQRQLKFVNSNNIDNDDGNINDKDDDVQLQMSFMETNEYQNEHPIGNNGIITQREKRQLGRARGRERGLGRERGRGAHGAAGEKSLNEVDLDEIIQHFDTISDPHTDQYTTGGKALSPSLSMDNNSDLLYGTGDDSKQNDIGTRRSVPADVGDDNGVDGGDGDDGDDGDDGGEALYMHATDFIARGEFAQPPLSVGRSVDVDLMLYQDYQENKPRMLHGTEGQKSSQVIARSLKASTL